MSGEAKLVYLCPEYPGVVSRFGGIGVSFQSEAEWFASQHYEVSVVCQTAERTPGVERQNNVEVHVISPSKVPKLRAVSDRWATARYIRRLAGSGPAVVICPDYTGQLTFKPFRQPLVVQLHGCASLNAVQQGRKPAAMTVSLERRLLRLANGIQSCSEFTASGTMKVLGLEGRPVKVIPNPTDASQFHPGETDPGAILFVGKFNRLKGVFVLAEAIPQVLRRVPGARLIMVGQDTTENGASVRSQFLERIPEDLRTRISIRDRLPRAEVAELMRRAAMLVLPSYTEAFPLVVVEAMASGRPVVASARGGIPEAVRDGVTGLLADPDRPETFTQAMLTLLASPDRAHEMGRAGHDRAILEFAPDRVYSRTRAFHEELLLSAGERSNGG